MQIREQWKYLHWLLELNAEQTTFNIVRLKRKKKKEQRNELDYEEH